MRMTITLIASVVAALIVSLPSVVGAQSCQPADSTFTPPLLHMKDLVVSSHVIDVATRQRLSIPTVDSSQVSVVNDTRICDKVLTAFKSSLEAGLQIPTKLFVMKVGTVYVALFPEPVKEADVYRVMSNKYAILSKFAK